MENEIIFILSHEKRWGSWMIFPYRAEQKGEFYLVGGRYSGEKEEGISPEIRKITALCKKYDSDELYKYFGRKRYKDERSFVLKETDDYIQENIKPYIEKYVSLVLDEIFQASCPLYLRNSRLDNIYKREKLNLRKDLLKPILRFEKSEENTRYILKLKRGDDVFSPASLSLKIITRKPCRILSGKDIYSFPDEFDGQRLMPFLEKEEVVISKVHENEYFKKFILKNIRNEEIEIEGFDIIIREVPKQAVLSLERGVFGHPLLVMEFCYGNRCIVAYDKQQSLVELVAEGESYAFYKVKRETEWEQQKILQAQGVGLKGLSYGFFSVVDTYKKEEENNSILKEREKEEAWENTISWISRHLALLKNKGIDFKQDSLPKPYFLGGWKLDYSTDETMDWFEIKAHVTLTDGRVIPFFSFRENILAGNRECILNDGSIFLIPQEWFAEYGEIMLFAQGRNGNIYLHRNQYTLMNTPTHKNSCWGENIELKIKNPENIFLPEGLNAELRPYQHEGYRWIYNLYQNGLGGCLADDMGLGKTVQTIAMLLKYKQESVKSSAGFEFPEMGLQLNLFDQLKAEKKEPKQENTEKTFYPCLVVVPASLVHNWKKELNRFAPDLKVLIYAGTERKSLRAFLKGADVIIITYHTLRNDVEYFCRSRYGYVILDEAQIIKNPDSQIHQALLRIKGEYFLALSGTPLENSLTDLWAIMNLVNRGVLGSYHFFREHFIKPVMGDIGGVKSQVLNRLIAPYILRRTKEEVLDDLPELTEETIFCEPTEEQKKLYEEERSRVRNYVMDKKENQEILKSDFIVLQALTRLRQIATHPRMVYPDNFYNSGKFVEVFRMLEEVVGSGHKVLIFSAFVKCLDLVAEGIEKQGWNYTMLTGSTTNREKVIEQFRQDKACSLFLISLKAGGVGLNLTEADYVFILDPWWNLAAEYQAISRAHRIGQKNAVFVYRFITVGTLEEKILKIQQRKLKLTESVMSSSPITDKLDEEEMWEVLEVD